MGFQLYIPLRKQTNDKLIGIASTLSIDRDGEKMSSKAIESMRRQIVEKGVNLFGNHEHQWENTLGAVNNATISNNQLLIETSLDDPVTNPKVNMLLNKMKRGIKLGLSVGGSVTKDDWDYDRELGKKVHVIDDVKLYEISVVGIPSNADSFLNLPNAIGKSMKFKKSLRTELDELKEDVDDLTTSDLQGAVSVIARKYNVDEDDALNYIYDGDTSVFEKKCPCCLSLMKSNKCEVCLWKKN